MSQITQKRTEIFVKRLLYAFSVHLIAKFCACISNNHAYLRLYKTSCARLGFSNLLLMLEGLAIKWLLISKTEKYLNSVSTACGLVIAIYVLQTGTLFPYLLFLLTKSYAWSFIKYGSLVSSNRFEFHITPSASIYSTLCVINCSISTV